MHGLCGRNVSGLFGGLGMLELRRGHLLGGRGVHVLELHGGHLSSRHRGVHLRGVRRRYCVFNAQRHVVVDMCALHGRRLLVGLGERVHELRLRDLPVGWRRVGLLGLLSGHLPGHNWVKLVRRLPRGHVLGWRRIDIVRELRRRPVSKSHGGDGVRGM